MSNTASNNPATRNARQGDFDATYGSAFAPNKTDNFGISGSETVGAGKGTSSSGHFGDTSTQTAFGGSAFGGRKAFDADNFGTNGSQTSGAGNAAAVASGPSGCGNPGDGFASEQTAITGSGTDAFGAARTYDASGTSNPFESKSTPHHEDVRGTTGAATYGSGGAHPFELSDSSNTDVSGHGEPDKLRDTAKTDEWSFAKTGADTYGASGTAGGAGSHDASSKAGAHSSQEEWQPRHAPIHREENFSASRDNDRDISRNTGVQGTSTKDVGTRDADIEKVGSGVAVHDEHHHKASLADKVIGGAEKFAGKVTGNAGLVEKGQERKTDHGM